MSLDSILGLIQTALELGLISSLTVLALFLSYSMLGVCDLSTDGCFTLGATVGAAIAIAGHPYLARFRRQWLAGMLSGLVTAVLQTKMGVNSLLSGIIVNTALYSVNIAVMGGSSVLNMNKTPSVFSDMKDLLAGSSLSGEYKLAVAVIAVVLVCVFLGFFLKTRLGLAIRATGNNPDMVRSSSINPVIHNDHRALHFQRPDGALRLPSCPVAEIRQHRHRLRHGDGCACVASHRARLPRKAKASAPDFRHGTGRVCLPSGLYDRAAL